MEKVVTISTKPYPAHEDGISLGVQQGYLFRNNSELNELYKEGYRIKTYTASSATDGKSAAQSTIQVYLEK